jgi:predicted esterase
LPGSHTASGPHAGQPIVQAGKPLGQSAVVAIMLHGRGAGPENILDLAQRLERPSVTYLAPAAENRTWYPYSFMADIERNEPHLSSALSVLRALVEQVEEAGIGRGRIVMMGFSQGACLTTEFAIRNASRFGGIAALSGGAIGPPGTKWATENADHPTADLRRSGFDGTPMFFGCSDVDAHVPEARVRESAELCARMGAQVTTKIYPGMGHLVNEDEIAHARKLIDQVVRGS